MWTIVITMFQQKNGGGQKNSETDTDNKTPDIPIQM